MRKNIIMVATVAVILGVGVGYTLHEIRVHSPAENTHKHDRYGRHIDPEYTYMSDNTHEMHMMPDGSMMQNNSNASGMNHMNMVVTNERDFLLGMIPHHEEAVATAREVLARGGSTPEIRTLAENIITAQEQEIASMKEWYETWYNTPYQADGTYMPMMRDLSKLRGSDLDYVFLQDMIEHHKGAIVMAESITPHIIHSEMTNLTTAIKNTQQSEIASMERLLITLEIDMPDLR